MHFRLPTLQPPSSKQNLSSFPPPYMYPNRPNDSQPATLSIATPTSKDSDGQSSVDDGSLKPYLGLRARYSLAWLAYPILILALILIQLILSLQSVQDGVSDTRRELQSSCAGLEGAASVAVSIPHFMADQTNNFLVAGAEDIVHGLALVLDLSIRAIEAIILYVIDTYRSLYLCLAEFVVRGSLALLIAAVQEAEKVFAEAVSGVRTAIQSTIGGAESLFNGAINDLNKIPGVHIQPPNLQIPDLNPLQNVKIPTGFSDSLSKLNSSLPTLAELRDSLDKLITTPFEEMRVDVTAKLRDAKVDRSLLKVPPKSTIRFCQNLNTSFVDEIGKIISFSIKFLIITTLVVILLIVIFNIFKQKFIYHSLISNLRRSRESWLSNDLNNSLSDHSLLAFLQSTKGPIVFKLVNRFRRLQKNNRPKKALNHNRVTWLIAYLTWPSALVFLGVGLLGFLVVEVQILALKGVRSRAINEANNGLDGISNLLVDKINSETGRASETFALDTNSVLQKFESDVNNHMLGWAGTTTTTLNNTLTTFYDGLTNTVNDTFGKTPLRDPSLELLNCLIGSKVAGIQAALTFVHDHAHVDLPRVSPTALMISPHQTQDLVDSFASPADQSTNDSDSQSQPSSPISTRFVDRMIDRYFKALKKQRITYFVLMASYLIVIFFGLTAFIWDIFRQSPRAKSHDLPRRDLSPPPSPPSSYSKINKPSKTEKNTEAEEKHNLQSSLDDASGGLGNETSKFRELSKDYFDKYAISSPKRLKASLIEHRPMTKNFMYKLTTSDCSAVPLPVKFKHQMDDKNLLQANHKKDISCRGSRDDEDDEPVSKFSPLTPSPVPGSDWLGRGKSVKKGNRMIIS